MADFTSPEAKKLNSILNKLQDDIKTLKGGASTSQLTYSSIDVNEGRGFIPVIENGEIKMRIGRQPDGSIATVSEGSGVPPVPPYQPLCTPVLGGVQVRCQGFISKQFSDFNYVKVYRDQAYYGNIIKVPGSIVVAPLSPGDHQFKLSSVNLAGQESALTEAVIAAPKQAVEEDIADGIITTLKIANDAITDAKVAVDAIQQRNIAPQAVGATEIADGSISTDKIAANTITADDIAANAITASKIAAEAIDATKIAASAITADKIAANAVTTDKILANAITSLQIASNTITSTNIQAGAIDATKLAAQLILASTQIIVGTLTGQRLVLDTQGLTQYNARGDLVLQFGAQTNKSNYLTILDKTDPSNALAAIADDGSLSVTGLTANGKVQINGVDLIAYLNSLPRGILARGLLTVNTAVSYATVGVFELQCDVVAGRTYKICSSMLYVASNAGLTFLYCAYTLDGSVPTVNSPRIFTWAASASLGYIPDGSTSLFGTTSPAYSVLFTPAASGRGRFIFYKQAYTGDVSTGHVGGGLLAPIQFWIEDLGIVYLNTGGDNPGGGTSSANGTYTTTWPCLYSGYSYDTNPDQGNGIGGPNQIFGAGTYQGQLNGTNYYSKLDFNYSSIQSTLAGATIHKVELYLYAYYWTLASGGWVTIGRHSSTQVASAYTYDDRNIENFKMSKPDGQWLQFTNPGWGTGFRDGVIKGLVLDARTSSHNSADNYGQFRRGGGLDGASVSPILRITYTK